VSVRHLCAVCLMVCLGAAAPARAQSEPTGNDPADSALKDIDDIVGGAYIPSELRDNPVQPPAGSESTIFEIYPLAERDNPLIDAGRRLSKRESRQIPSMRGRKTSPISSMQAGWSRAIFRETVTITAATIS